VHTPCEKGGPQQHPFENEERNILESCSLADGKTRRDQLVLRLSHFVHSLLVLAAVRADVHVMQKSGPAVFPVVGTVSVVGYIRPNTLVGEQLRRSNRYLPGRIQKDLAVPQNGATHSSRSLLQRAVP